LFYLDFEYDNVNRIFDADGKHLENGARIKCISTNFNILNFQNIPQTLQTF